MTDEEFDADGLSRIPRSVAGMEDRVRIIDTGRPGRIGEPRHRLLAADLATSAGPRDVEARREII